MTKITKISDQTGGSQSFPDMKPCLQPGLLSRLSLTEFDDLTAQWIPPILLPTEVQIIETEVLPGYRGIFQPAQPTQVVARITLLLAHFFTAAMDRNLAQAVLRDWVDSLMDQPFWAVEEACDEWIKTQSRKPTPADIRGLASRKTNRKRLEQGRLLAAVEASRKAQQQRPQTAEERAEEMRGLDQIMARWRSRKSAEPEKREPTTAELIAAEKVRLEGFITARMERPNNPARQALAIDETRRQIEHLEGLQRLEIEMNQGNRKVVDDVRI